MKTKNNTATAGWIVLVAWLVAILVMIAAILASTTTALAAPPLQITETPTPEPTPEPPVNYFQELSTGNQIEVVRSVTYGDIYIIGAIAFVGLILLLYALFRLITHYLH